MGKREKATGNSERNMTKVAAAVGAASLLAGAAGAIAYRLKKRNRDLQTYEPDAEGRRPEDYAAVLNAPTTQEERELLAEIAVRTHHASVDTAGAITSATLRDRLDARIPDEQIEAATSLLKDNRLIDPVYDDESGAVIGYSATSALDWAIRHGDDYPDLADAESKVINEALNESGNF